MILFNNTPLFTLGGSSPFWVLNIETNTGEGAIFNASGELPDGNLVLGIRTIQALPLGNPIGPGWVVCSPEGAAGLSRKKPVGAGRGGQNAPLTADRVSGSFFTEDARELVKYDSDFNPVFQRGLPDIGSVGLQRSALDGDVNLYVPGGGGLGTGPNILKIDSSGTLQWSRRLSRADFRSGRFSLDVYKPDGTVYAGMHNDNTGAVDTSVPIVFSYTSAGALRWQRRYTSAGESFNVAVSVYDEDEIYVTFGRGTSGGATPGVVVFKVDSSGDILWQKQILTGVEPDPPVSNALTTDDDGNLYFSFRILSGANVGTYVSKFSPTGDLIWTIKPVFNSVANTLLQNTLLVTDTSVYVGGPANRGSLARISKSGIELSGGDWEFFRVSFSTINPSLVVTNSNLTASSPAESLTTVTNPFTDTLVWNETLTRL